MKIIRVNQIAAIDHMADFFIPDFDAPASNMGANVKRWFSENPNGWFILQAWDEPENKEPELVAFLVAYAQDSLDHTFILQAWTRPSHQNSKLQDQMFSRLIAWTQNLGRSQIRAETARSPKGFMRRWNFREISTIMAFDVGEEFDNAVISQVMKKKIETFDPASLGEVIDEPILGNSEPVEKEEIKEPDMKTDYTPEEIAQLRAEAKQRLAAEATQTDTKAVRVKPASPIEVDARDEASEKNWGDPGVGEVIAHDLAQHFIPEPNVGDE